MVISTCYRGKTYGMFTLTGFKYAKSHSISQFAWYDIGHDYSVHVTNVILV